MQDDLTLALWQTPYAANTAEALLRLDAAAAWANAQGAQVLITPEMFLTGYAIGPERVTALAEPGDGPLAQAVADIAQRHGIAIVCGYPEHNPAGKPFNATQFIAPDGTRPMRYRKTHLYGDLDRAQFSAGDTASQVFTWHGWRLGLLICYDVEFPEAVRGLALQGADVVLVPTANMQGFDEVQRVLLPARALENRTFIAYANACDREGDIAYNGLSAVHAPDGTAIARADSGPALTLATLSSALRAQAQASTQLRDRRSELYGPLSQPQR